MSLQQDVTKVLPPLPGQVKRFVKNLFSPWCRIGALSATRGTGKSFTAGFLGSLAVNPHSILYTSNDRRAWTPGKESILVSGSIAQARICFGFLRQFLKDQGIEDQFKINDSAQKLDIRHKQTDTRLRCISSSAKRSLGLGSPLYIFDEPASFHVSEGELMFLSLTQSMGKVPNQKLCLIGTKSPSEEESWWIKLLETGTRKDLGIFIEDISLGEDEDWLDWSAIQRCNPMMRLNPNLRKVIRQEWVEAQENESKRKAFLAFRCNTLQELKHEMLCSVEQWQEAEKRGVPEREGRPLVALDLGSGRSWTAAWVLYRNGRSEAYALTGGIPSLQAKEREDSIPSGLYRRLHKEGTLLVDTGLRVPRPEILLNHLKCIGIDPECVLCDRFMVSSLKDAMQKVWSSVPLIERVTRYSESTFDIAATRKLIFDGPLSVIPECRNLAKFSISQAKVVYDGENCRIQKRRSSWKSRDDICICLSLASGELVRKLNKPAPAPPRLLVC